MLAGAVSLLVLMPAAVLEAGGDAILRTGLHAASLPARIGVLVLGGAVLFSYGVTVDLPPWDFGRLLGVYAALFFVVAQFINWLGFSLKPTPAILVGGALIIAGGLTITFWRA